MDKRIGAQLYTIREFCDNEKNLEKSIIKLRNMGYKVVQVSGIGDIAPEKIKEICDKHGMTIACTHRSFDEYKNNLLEMIEYHKKLGTKIAGPGGLAKEKRNTIEALKETLNTMNYIYNEFKKNGMTFAYHNHSAEFVKVNGKFFWDYFVELGEFDFIIDTYWIAYAGLDPAKEISRLGNRAKIIHYKDLAIKEDERACTVQTPIGNGNLNWDSIIEASKMCEYALVEQDICDGDPFDCMKISYDFLAKKGFC